MKIGRLIGILSILLQQEKVTAPMLAEKFEVSRRTINRDVEELCQAGIPIITEQGANGGISIISDYKIDRTLLTTNEMQAILSGLKSLDSVSGGNQYQTLMDKLSVRNSEILADNQYFLIDLSSWNTRELASRIELLQTAIKQHHIVSFSYYGPGGQSIRSVEPYQLVFRWQAWYLWSYCLLRKEFRLFKLCRMGDFTVQTALFEPREVEDLEEPPLELCNPNNIRVQAVFDAAVKWRLVEELDIKAISGEKNGRIYMDFTWSDQKSLFSYLLGFGSGVELIGPEALREAFAVEVKEIYDKYKKHDR